MKSRDGLNIDCTYRYDTLHAHTHTEISYTTSIRTCNTLHVHVIIN